MEKIELYDDLLKIAHKYPKLNLLDRIIDSKLFIIDGEEIHQGDVMDELCDYYLSPEVDSWCIPFDSIVCFLNHATDPIVLVISDIDGQQGAFARRQVIAYYRPNKKSAKESLIITGEYTMTNLKEMYKTITKKISTDEYHDYIFKNHFFLDKVYSFTKLKFIQSMDDATAYRLQEEHQIDPVYMNDGFVTNYHTALKATIYESIKHVIHKLMYSTVLNNEFVLETAPKKTFHHKLKKSNQQSQYIYLTSRQIRTTIKLPNNAPKGTKQPHDRRRHPRTLRSERYGERQGETIWIPACWIGPSEATGPNKIYKVRLDL